MKNLEKAKKKFKKLLVRELENTSASEKKNIIDEFMNVLKESLSDVGVGVHIQHITPDISNSPSIPEHIKEFLNSLKGISKKIDDTEVKYDKDVKEIGDSVKLIGQWASSYMHDFVTKEQLSKNYDTPIENFIGETAIVVEKDLDFKFNCGHCEETHLSDIVIYFPSKQKRYHTLSKLVKII